MNRRKSTCSPICAISEAATVAAAPKANHENSSPCSLRPLSVVNSRKAPGSLIATATNGRTSSASHSGCVQSCSREISVTPCVTSGITITAEST